MIKRLENYKEKGSLLSMYTKQKNMEFWETRRKKKTIENSCRKMKENKEWHFINKYHILTGDNNDIKDVKAKALMDEIRGIRQTLCVNNYNRRMVLYKTVIKGIEFYDIENWDWREYEEIEVLYEK